MRNNLACFENVIKCVMAGSDVKIYSMLRRKVINLVSNVSNFPMCHSHINGLLPWADSEGGGDRGSGPPLKKSQKYRVS